MKNTRETNNCRPASAVPSLDAATHQARLEQLIRIIAMINKANGYRDACTGDVALYSDSPYLADVRDQASLMVIHWSAVIERLERYYLRKLSNVQLTMDN